MTGAIFTGTRAIPTSVSVLSKRTSTTTSPNSNAKAEEIAVMLSISFPPKRLVQFQLSKQGVLR